MPKETKKPTPPVGRVMSARQYHCMEPNCDNCIPGVDDADSFIAQYWYDGGLGMWDAGWYCEDSLDSLYTLLGFATADMVKHREFDQHLGPHILQYLQDEQDIIVFRRWQPTGVTCYDCRKSNIVNVWANETTRHRPVCDSCYRKRSHATT